MPSEDQHIISRLSRMNPLANPAESTSELAESAAAIHTGVGEVLGTSEWLSLAELLLVSSTSVFLYGVAPRNLIEALKDLIESGKCQSPPEITYYTPLPELALSQHASTHTARYRNRWQAGFIGLRNIVRALANTSEEAPVGAVKKFYGVSAYFLDCIVRIQRKDLSVKFILLTVLPGSALRDDFTQVVITQLKSGDEGIERMLQSLRESAVPIRLREVLCHRYSGTSSMSPDAGYPTLRIDTLIEYGSSSQPTGLTPIAIVVVRCGSPRGRQVILKIRGPLTDNDDFGKLSLLSARLQESDLAAAYGQQLSDSDDDESAALEQLWISAGQPEPFVIPIDAYCLAAQREASLTLGLEVSKDRLEFKGFQVVDREGTDQQLGFAVFVLDLKSDKDSNEVGLAVERNGDSLRRVQVTELYDDPTRLNRLLIKRKEWLVENCFKT